VQSRTDGRIKLYLTQCVLNYRKQHAALFAEGDYLALDAAGPKADHLCAFARRQGDETVLVAVTRFAQRLYGGNWASAAENGQPWTGTVLVVPEAIVRPGDLYRNLLTGEVVSVVEQNGVLALPLSELFAALPVAICERIDQGGEHERGTATR
jgi:(1->4)-alpha-D-glucan 1-alpha-D-glucosylmutase